MIPPRLPFMPDGFGWILSVWLAVVLGAGRGVAGGHNLAKYPLRVHVLASDETHLTPRMGPSESVTCDSIEGMLDSISPNPGGPVTLSGVSSDPCLYHAQIVAGRFMDLPDEDRVYSGEGRGDLVTPPATTEGMTFHYDNCVRVRPGFESLRARWKKPGRKLEVLISSDEIPVSGRTLPPVKCSLTVTMHNFVYLLLRNGKVVEVAQDVYRAKPALRVFLSGGTATLEPRAQAFSRSAH